MEIVTAVQSKKKKKIEKKRYATDMHVGWQTMKYLTFMANS